MKRRMGVVVAVALALPLISVSTAAADGEPAPGFGLNGVVIDNFVTAGYHLTSVEATQLTDGSFLVAGSLAGLIEISGTRHFLARFLANGQLDTSFGSGGVQRIAQRLSGLVPAPDGTALAILHINNEPDSPTMSVSMPRFGGIGPLGLGLATQLIVRPDGAVFEVMEPSAVNPVIVWIVRPGSDFRFDGTSILPPGGSLGGNDRKARPTATLLSDGRLVVAFAYSSGTPNQTYCGVAALLPNGSPDRTFGTNGLYSVRQSLCHVDHLAGDTIRLVGAPTDPVVAISPNGQPLGEIAFPLNAGDLQAEGTGWSYAQSAPNEIVGLDPSGTIDVNFGTNGFATVPGTAIRGFKLLESGNLLAWGTAAGDDTKLALALIHASFGTAAQPPALDTSKFVPVPPQRILDTREGLGAPLGKLGVGEQIDLQVAGVGGVPATDVSAVVLNVTATDATQAGFVTAYPSGGRRPNASNLNADRPGQTAANLVAVKVGSNGKVTLFSSGGTNLVADVAGYYTPAFTSTAGRLQTASPRRVLDTREGLGAPKAKLPAGGQIDLQVTGARPVPTSGVSAVVLNVTADQASADGYVTVWPAGGDRPVVSNLNLVTGETRPNLVIVPVGAGGKISLFTQSGAELIADVAGWFTDSTAADESAGLFVPITPTRMLDTRRESTSPTTAGSSVTRRIGSTMVVPPSATVAVAANITVTQATGAGFVTAWPAHTDRPTVSNLNTTTAGQTIPNAAIVPLGQDDLALYTQTGAQLIVDINGWYTNF